MTTPGFAAWRCGTCGRFLAEVVLVPGAVLVIKCRCGVKNTIALPEPVAAR